MSRDPGEDPENKGQHTETSEAERQEKIAKLHQRRSPLTPDEAALLRKEFRRIIKAHHKQVWNSLRRRRLERHVMWEIYQEVFLELYTYLVAKGFPDQIPGVLKKIIKWKVLDHGSAQKGDSQTDPWPSSGSEKASAPDLERAMDLRALSQHILPLLSPQNKEVFEKVVLKELSHREAAEVLGLTEGQVKGRLAAAERTLHALAKRRVPPSQRGPA